MTKFPLNFAVLLICFFPLAFEDIWSLVLSPSFERILSFTAAETADSVDWEMLGLASWTKKQRITMLHIENDYVLTVTKAIQTCKQVSNLESPNKTLQDKL